MKRETLLIAVVAMALGLGIGNLMRTPNDAHAIGGFERTTSFNTEVTCPNGSYLQLPDINAKSYSLRVDPDASNDVRLCTTESGDLCAVLADGAKFKPGDEYHDDENNPDAWRCFGDGATVTLFIQGSVGQ